MVRSSPGTSPVDGFTKEGEEFKNYISSQGVTLATTRTVFKNDTVIEGSGGTTVHDTCRALFNRILSMENIQLSVPEKFLLSQLSHKSSSREITAKEIELIAKLLSMDMIKLTDAEILALQALI